MLRITMPSKVYSMFALGLFYAVGGIAAISSAAYADNWNLYPYEADYLIFLDNLEVGTSHRSVSIDNNVVISTHKVEPNAMAKIFGEKRYQQTSKFYREYKNINMIETRIKGRDTDPSAKFDWENNTIHFGNGKTEPISNSNILDLESWLVSVQINPAEMLTEEPFLIVDRNRLRSYQYTSVSPTVIEIQDVKVDAWLIEMRRVDRENEGFRVWIVAEFRAIPAQIEKFKKGSSLFFRIQSLKWASDS